MDYPSFVGVVSYLGLDPITVWYEYRIPFLVGAALLLLLLAAGIYWLSRAVIAYAANFHYSFADRQPFYRAIGEMEAEAQERIRSALAGEEFTLAMPAIASHDVPGYRKTVGFVVLSPKRLIFVPKEGKDTTGVGFLLTTIPDANIHDGKKFIELKLLLVKSKPTFQLLGISRDHAQELFMKMHSYRQAAGGSRS
jgi:hypothetical protein